MSPLSLDLEPPEVPVEPCDPSESEAPTLTFPYVEGGLLPGRGLLYSLLAHEVVFFLIIFLSLIAIHHKQMIPPSRQWELTMMPKEAIYLPQLGGGHEGSGGRGVNRAPGRRRCRPRRSRPQVPAGSVIPGHRRLFPIHRILPTGFRLSFSHHCLTRALWPLSFPCPMSSSWPNRLRLPKRLMRRRLRGRL